MPAKSRAPMVTTALYFVFCASTVVVFPKGLSLAFRLSELSVTTTSVIRVRLLSGLTLKSLNVVALMVEALIFSEKAAVRLVPRPTPVARLSGVVLFTVGLVISTVSVRASDTAEVLPTASVALAVYVCEPSATPLSDLLHLRPSRRDNGKEACDV